MAVAPHIEVGRAPDGVRNLGNPDAVKGSAARPVSINSSFTNARRAARALWLGPVCKKHSVAKRSLANFPASHLIRPPNQWAVFLMEQQTCALITRRI